MDQQNSFNQVMGQIGEFARGLTLKQKVLLIGGALLVGVTLFVFVKLIHKPDFKPLYTGMKADEAQAMAARLASKKIEYELSPDGTSISVPSDQLDAARLESVAEGVPRSGRMGFEIFDKPNWGGSDFSEKVNYQRALEGELERTIQTLSEVESARVHLVLPEESLFLQDQRNAKAAVIVKLRGERYTDETGKSISRLVASAVDRLRPEDVTVVDADTNRPLSPESDGILGPTGSELEQQLAEKVVHTLEPVIGAQGARASVRLEYDPTSGEEQQETYDPDATVAISLQKSEESSGTRSYSGGVPGTASNVPGSQTSQVAATRPDEGSMSSSKTENGTYAVNKVIRRTVLPAGRFKRIAAALIVDDAMEISNVGGRRQETRRKRTPEEMNQIQEIAKAALGIDASRGDILSVQNLSFQQDTSDQISTPTLGDRARKIVNDYSGVLRYVGIVLLFVAVYLVLLRPVKRQAIDAFRQIGGASARSKLVAGTKASSASQPMELDASEITTNEMAVDAKRASALKRHLLEKVKSEPLAASRLVQSWMRQGVDE